MQCKVSAECAGELFAKVLSIQRDQLCEVLGEDGPCTSFLYVLRHIMASCLLMWDPTLQQGVEGWATSRA